MSRRPGEPAPLRIEAENEWAWCGARRLEITPKAFAVLRHLVSNAGRLVTKRELLDGVWGDTIVSESALASCIRDLRRALDDSSRAPRYLETVHRRGFRFIGPLEPARGVLPSNELEATGAPTQGTVPAPLVGRDGELARLDSLFEGALGGRRRVVFVTGEAGIGKTALVETFLTQIESANGLRIARGQCVEQYGAGEAYLPVLEALGRMGRDPAGDALVAILRQFAPTWLAQLPALLDDEELEAVQRRAQSSTRERMLRELIEAVDALSVETPLVLVLEDLHWSDSATIDLLAMLARRRDPARLLIVGTYRPADVAAELHPLKLVKYELQLHGHCDELALDFLGEAAIEAYLAERLPGGPVPCGLARVLHANTNGNPLFLVNLIDDLIARGRLRDVDGRWELAVPVCDLASEVPPSLWQMVDEQIEHLSPAEQSLLAVASVAGAEFSAAIATAGGVEVDEAEQCSASLVRRGRFLRALGVSEWPDGTVAERYGFIHSLYRNVLYERVSIGRRIGLHLRIGDRLERAHGEHAASVAGELAMHFEAGRDFERAVRYQRLAADNALRHHAHREAASHSGWALKLLDALPESTERLRQELAIQTTLGAALIPHGSAAPEVVRAYGRARDLCARVGAAPELVPALVGLSGYYISRADLQIAREIAEQFSMLAEAADDEAILLGAHNAAGMVSFYSGDFADALARLERGLELHDPRRYGPRQWPAFWGGHDPGVSCASHAAWTLWALGHPERAVRRMREALDWSRSAAYPFTLANACVIAAVFHACRRDVDGVRELSDEAMRHAAEHGFELLLQAGGVLRGWLRSETGEREEGTAQVRSSLAAYRATGAGIGVPTFLGLLAEAEGRCGRPEEGLAALSDARAMSESSGAHYWDAELRRLEGALLLLKGGVAHAGRSRRARPPANNEAEARFRDAIEIARRQGAKSLELRAATSLARLWQVQRKTSEARALLEGIYGTFDEGIGTFDLTEACAVLDAVDAAASRR